jgi:hypothetical protein
MSPRYQTHRMYNIEVHVSSTIYSSSRLAPFPNTLWDIFHTALVSCPWGHMRIFRSIKYCGKLITNTEYSTSKPCSQINLASFHLVVFLIRATDSELDAKNKVVPCICTFSYNCIIKNKNKNNSMEQDPTYKLTN